jgi:hypothetical protein
MPRTAGIPDSETPTGVDGSREADWLSARPEEIRELIELVARSLRPIYPLETDCGFDELLRTLDQHGL